MAALLWLEIEQRLALVCGAAADHFIVGVPHQHLRGAARQRENSWVFL